MNSSYVISSYGSNSVESNRNWNSNTDSAALKAGGIAMIEAARGEKARKQ
jgi:hypothetical protein